MNFKLMKTLILIFLTLPAGFITAANDNFSISSTQKWDGTDFFLTNNLIILKPDVPLVTLRTPIEFHKKNDYILEVEYQWKGNPAKRKIPFYVDLYVPGKWDGAEYNFVPDSKKCVSGVHKFKKIFNPINAPDNLWLRIIKQTPAEIIIRKINVRPVEIQDALMLKLKKSNKFDYIIVWLFLQIFAFTLFLWLFIRKEIKVEAKSYKVKKHLFLGVIALILVLLIFAGFKWRYNYFISKSVSINLLKNKWKSVEMKGEGGDSKIVSISKAPAKLNGYYWLNVSINIPGSVKKNEEFIVDFFGEDYDTADTKVHIPMSGKTQKHITRKALLYFDTPPSNLYVMAYSTYNSRVELKKLTLRKKPTFTDILLLKSFSSHTEKKKEDKKQITTAENIQIIPGNCNINVDNVKCIDDKLIIHEEINKILFGIPVTLAQKKSYIFEVDFETSGKYAFDDSLWFDLYKPSSWNANFHNFIIPQYLIKNGKHKWQRAFYSDLIPANATLRCYKKGNFEYKISNLSIKLLTFKVLLLKLITKPEISGVLIVWFAFGYIWLFINKKLSKKYIVKYAMMSLVILIVIALFNITEMKLIYSWLKGILC